MLLQVDRDCQDFNLFLWGVMFREIVRYTLTALHLHCGISNDENCTFLSPSEVNGPITLAYFAPNNLKGFEPHLSHSSCPLVQCLYVRDE
jgi:hypothetical protein